jgi:NAD(P)-dependent dehydrogenase (short-subunit alcohol dehydrogenase family)
MKRLLVLGGTRGIGLALARHYLAQGWHVTVAGRQPERIKNSDLLAYPQLSVHALDVGDPQAVEISVREAGAGVGLDLLIVSAGLYFNTRLHPMDEGSTESILRTNIGGLVHAVQSATPAMLARRSGHIVAIASVAGLLRDYPGASAYSATKRAVIQLCDAYRKAMSPWGITVTAVVPGYMDTERLRELNGGDARHKPFLMTEEQAVQRIVAAIEARQDRVVFPWQMRWVIALLNRVPLWPLLQRWLIGGSSDPRPRPRPRAR